MAPIQAARCERAEGLTDDVVKVRKEWHAEKDGNQPFLELYAAKELGGLVARSSRPADRCHLVMQAVNPP